ncbi:G1/S regulator [Drepanopeziza brunnea f. sp. 'multigermtubi' MB_m1]|uniref:G1/S regulator n=1 Tax=Marssonina brunnea f. sp. multigermtubi (strain MB_m1) TaxID=1072389 RepID=K1WS79_MARBU|nr:G1/S regulator [Drepanopeziza brunnea f. sp. 'multigermtubi' MB_m1]EKD15217.1 G1/S regulator [Drepanopeziza brunnea f. sp. 'multigermtubi' MB_m1]
MSSKRVPLSNNPHAVNSPYRSAAGAASKPKRAYATIQREEAYGQPPPAKKQMLDNHPTLRTPPRQQITQPSAEGRVFTRRSNITQQSAFERKLVAARERPQQVITKVEKTSEENLETIRQWQKHYRKIFPNFVFYFESVQEDVRVKCTKQVIALGAREEKFFSNAVTHVVTTRTIPPAQQTSSTDTRITSSTNDSQSGQAQTINPSLLDRSSESANELGGRTKFTFDAPVNRRTATHSHDGEVKKQQVRNADVLYRARELGMKIWALEKLQRMMTTMFDTETGYQAAHGHNTRSNSVSTTIPRTTRQTDLSQLLRNERINGPSDRDPTVATKEITLFKGPFIYIHDIDEKQRPIMVREYSKVANKEHGDWPQFRSVAHGKCPFVEEVDNSRREAEKEDKLRLQRQQEKEKAMIPRTRAAAAFQAAKMQPPKAITGKRTLSEMDSASNRGVTVSTKQINPFAPSNGSLSHDIDQEASSRGNAFVSRAGVGRLFGGEPVASGLQPSNITSAIRSTVISSTAAQPGAKAGTSKEVHGLQRKVLEKNSGGPASYNGPSSHRMTDANATAREEAVNKPSKIRGRDKLSLIEEDVNPSETERHARKVEATRKARAAHQRKVQKRDPKPGYCENCQDKFDDFDEHILSRKHRKFAEKLENWTELDALLGQLLRPRRHKDV